MRQSLTLMPGRILLLASIALLGAAGPAAQEKVAAEIARLALDAPKVLPEQSRPAIMARLDRARAALATGDIYLALYDLQPAYESEAGYRLAMTEKNHADQAAFKRKWTEMGLPADPPAAGARVLFVEALAQSAEGRAPATYRASLPYAQDAGLMAGLYYLGESHAMVRFAALCRDLQLPDAGRRPEMRSIEPSLAAYETTVVKAYDTAAAAQRPQYAAVNVAIKLARTLDEQQRYEGALLQYLVSRYRYQVIAWSDRPGASADDVRRKVAGTRLPSGKDHSIAAFFLQLASASLTGTDPSPRNAEIILDDILPAYFSVMTK